MQHALVELGGDLVGLAIGRETDAAHYGAAGNLTTDELVALEVDARDRLWDRSMMIISSGV